MGDGEESPTERPAKRESARVRRGRAGIKHFEVEGSIVSADPTHRPSRTEEERGPSLFVTSADLAHHMKCSRVTLKRWIADGVVPRPHSCPGERHSLWKREHWEAFVASGRWPDAAWNIWAGR